MARYYKRKYQKKDEFEKIMTGITVFYGLYLLLFWFFDREKFWWWLIYGLIAFVLLILGMIIFYKLKRKFKKRKIKRIIDIIKNAGLEEYVNDFISSYGLGNQEKREKSWNYRDYSIAWYRIKDLNKYLKVKNINFSDSDICLLLIKYIEEREFKKMEQVQGVSSYYFKDLSGTDFERLLCRLYEKMGYNIQHTGKAGDQGGDLVVMKGGKRIVVQAKRYKTLINNKAIQEAVAAKAIYNCSNATVVTTSDFTDGALELAKSNYVYLINGKKLKELLLYYLKENWQFSSTL